MSTTPPLRSLTAVLREADACTELAELDACWKEIVATRFQRPLVDIQFACEHLVMLAGKLGARDGAELRAQVEPLLNAIGIHLMPRRNDL